MKHIKTTFEKWDSSKDERPWDKDKDLYWNNINVIVTNNKTPISISLKGQFILDEIDKGKNMDAESYRFINDYNKYLTK